MEENKTYHTILKLRPMNTKATNGFEAVTFPYTRYRRIHRPLAPPRSLLNLDGVGIRCGSIFEGLQVLMRRTVPAPLQGKLPEFFDPAKECNPLS